MSKKKKSAMQMAREEQQAMIRRLYRINPHLQWELACEARRRSYKYS